jgi:hypothetical protein
MVDMVVEFLEFGFGEAVRVLLKIDSISALLLTTMPITVTTLRSKLFVDNGLPLKSHKDEKVDLTDMKSKSMARVSVQ